MSTSFRKVALVANSRKHEFLYIKIKVIKPAVKIILTLHVFLRQSIV